MARVEFYETNDLPGHMALVRRAVDRSLNDPETVQLARKLVNGRFDWVEHPKTRERVPVVEAWGEQFWAPTGPICGPQDDACELRVLWDFLVLNCRYVYDPEHADTFSTLKQSLLARGGDCDDATVAFCALARAIGFAQCYARVVSVSGDAWEHVYPMIGCPKDNPTAVVPLDITVPDQQPGWQVSPVAYRWDFPMAG